ncbi:MAG: site-specific DNA-methyltransferase [Elusimicrobia bacterium]|nr:site-specific DNA-methyltransferase [Elusimicrobiota bacterium]
MKKMTPEIIGAAELYRGDCLKVLEDVVRRHPHGAFDLIFADPPYFLSNGGITCKSGRMAKVDKGAWDKSRGADENHEFNRRWLSLCQKALKPDGTIWISGTAHVIHSVGFALQQLGFKILNDVAWVKRNPPPNLSCRYFTHASETLIWAAKSAKSRHFFAYQDMKRDNGGKQMKSVWDILPPAASEKKFGKHPTQKPLELLRRVIRASSKPGDLVFDPFMGSGTTGAAALELGRRFAGVELDKKYYALAKARISAQAPAAKVLPRAARHGAEASRDLAAVS